MHNNYWSGDFSFLFHRWISFCSTLLNTELDSLYSTRYSSLLAYWAATSIWGNLTAIINKELESGEGRVIIYLKPLWNAWHSMAGMTGNLIAMLGHSEWRVWFHHGFRREKVRFDERNNASSAHFILYLFYSFVGKPYYTVAINRIG